VNAYAVAYEQEIKRYLSQVRERVLDKIKMMKPEEQYLFALQHSVAAQKEALKACGPMCAVLSTYFVPIVHRQWLHDYLSGRLDSAWRLGVFGTLGSGKSTYAFWIAAIWYLATRGYCKIRMPEVRGIGDVFPPVADCSVDIMREPLPEVRRAIVYDVAGLKELAKENYRAILRGEYPPVDVVVFDEAAASAFSALTYFRNKRVYVLAGQLAQLIRTTAPFVVVTAPELKMLSKYMRRAVSYIAYMAVDAQKPYVVNVRLDVATEPRGLYRIELMEHLRDALLRPAPDGVKMPDWFYREHVAWRINSIERMFERLERMELEEEEPA